MRTAALVLVLFSALSTASNVSYDAVFHGNGSLEIDAVITLDGPADNYSWHVPDGMRVLEARNKRGSLNYAVEGELAFFSNPENATTIRFFSPNQSDCSGPVCNAGFGGGGFEGAPVPVSMRFENADFFASDRKTSVSGNALVFEGNGSFYESISFISKNATSFSRKDFTHYSVFAPAGDDYSAVFNSVESRFHEIGRITGLKSPCERFAVVTAGDDKIGKNFGGDYVSPCVIRFKRAAITAGSDWIPEQFAEAKRKAEAQSLARAGGSVIHETTHGFERVLPETPSWFKEGLSVLVETRYYEEMTGAASTNRIKLKALEDFYLKSGKWKEGWSPLDNQTKEQRDFGYSYSFFIMDGFDSKYGDAAIAKTIAELNKSAFENRYDKADTKAVLGAMRTAAGANVSDEELLYPFKSVLLAQGKDLFEKAVENLTIGSAENATLLNANQTAGQTGAFDSTALAFVIGIAILALLVPIIVLAAIAYAIYKIAKKLLGK